MTDTPQPSIEPGEAANTARRRRSIAIGIVLAVLVATFYAVTIFKMGPAILDRPL